MWVETWTGSEFRAVVGDDVGKWSWDLPLVRLMLEVELLRDGRLLLRLRFERENEAEMVERTPWVRDLCMV